MDNRYIVRDIVRGTRETFHPGKLVWYIWDRKLQRLSFAYYLSQNRAQQICDIKNQKEI